MKNIVIVGGGQAAAWATFTLREEGFSGNIHVVSDEEHAFYERPPLSKENLLAPTSVQQMLFFPAEDIDAFNVHWHRPHRVVTIAREKQFVQLDNHFQLHYDKLLLAMGSGSRMPDPQWQDLSGVYTLRTFEQSNAFRERLAQTQHLVIVGGGWIGLEAASSARQHGIKTTVLEVGPQLCGRSTRSEVAQYLHELHESQGVEIVSSCGTLELSQAENGTDVVVTLDGQQLTQADTVLVAAGAQLNTQLAEQCGLEVANGIVVDEYGQTSDPHIYAAGDVAIHPQLGFSMQSWSHAQNQGIAVAKNMLGQQEPYVEIPWLWSDQYDSNIQMLGNPAQAAQCVVRESDINKKTFFYFNEQQQICYVVAINEPRNIKLAKRWLQRGVLPTPEQLGDPATNLMRIR